MSTGLPHITSPRHGNAATAAPTNDSMAAAPTPHNNNANHNASNGKFGLGNPMVTNGVSVGLGTVGLGERCQQERERARREHYKQWKREKAYSSPLRSSAAIKEAEANKSPRSTKERYMEKKARHNEAVEKQQAQDERRLQKSRDESAKWKTSLKTAKDEEREFTETFTRMCRELDSVVKASPPTSPKPYQQQQQGGTYTGRQLRADAQSAVAMVNAENTSPTGEAGTTTLIPAPPATAPPATANSTNYNATMTTADGYSPSRSVPRYQQPLPFQSSFRSFRTSSPPLTPRQQSIRDEVEWQAQINNSVRNIDEDVRQSRIQKTHPIIASQMNHTHDSRIDNNEEKTKEVSHIRTVIGHYKSENHRQHVDREKDYNQIAKEQRASTRERITLEKDKLEDKKLKEAEKVREQSAKLVLDAASSSAASPAHRGSNPSGTDGAVTSTSGSARSPSPRRHEESVRESKTAAATAVRQQRELLKTTRDADRQAEMDRNVQLYQEARAARQEQKRIKEEAELAAAQRASHQAPAPTATHDDHDM